MLLKKISCLFLCISLTAVAYSMDKVKEAPSLYKTIITFWANECLKKDLNYTLELEKRVRNGAPYAIDDLQSAIINFNPAFFFKELAPASCKGLRGHKTAITLVALNSTGTYVASASKDNEIRLWDLKKRVCEVFNNHKSMIIALAFSKDNQTLASVSSDCVAQLIDSSQKKVLITRTFKPSWSQHAVHCSLSPNLECALLELNDHSSCLAYFGQGSTTIWRLNLIIPGCKAVFSPNGIYVLLFSPAVNYLELFELNLLINLDDAAPIDGFLRITHNAQGTISASLSGDSNHIIFATNDGRTHIVSIAHPIMRTIDASSNLIIPESILNHNGTQALFNKSSCMCIFLKNFKTNPHKSTKLVAEDKHSTGALVCTSTPCAHRIINAFHPEGTMALTAWHSKWEPNDSKTLLWLLQEHPEPLPTPLSTELINAAAFSSDGRYLIAGYEDGIVRLWDFHEAKKPHLTLTQLIAMLKFSQGSIDPAIEAVLNSLPFSRTKVKESCRIS